MGGSGGVLLAARQAGAGGVAHAPPGAAVDVGVGGRAAAAGDAVRTGVDLHQQRPRRGGGGHPGGRRHGRGGGGGAGAGVPQEEAAAAAG